MNQWQLIASHAQWQSSSLRVAFDPVQPRLGLALAHLALPTACELRLFGLLLPSDDNTQARCRPPVIACGNSLHATYDAVEPFPIRTDAGWTIEPPRSNSSPTIVEAVLSVITEELNAQPQFSVRSIVPAVEVLTADPALSDPTLCWTPWNPEVQGDADRAKSPLVLFRLPGETLSYVEMIHPADFHSCRIAVDQHPALALDRTLFATTLERGVILRARLRGVLLDRCEDTTRAAQTYADFVRSEPPLSR